LAIFNFLPRYPGTAYGCFSIYPIKYINLLILARRLARRFSDHEDPKSPKPGETSEFRFPESDPYLAASTSGRQIALMKSLADNIFMGPSAYTIKSIVLIDFTNIVKIASGVPSSPPKQLLLNIVF
jgi:hypothetical protein